MIQGNKVSNFFKTKKGLNSNKNINKKSYNLKQLHRSLYDEHPNKESSYQPSRKRFLNKRQSAKSIHNSGSKNLQKQKLASYYLNVDKITNLKISNKEKKQFNNKSSYLNNYDKQHRRSLMLKKYQKSKRNLLLSVQYKKKTNRSYYNSAQNLNKKSKARYKTEDYEINRTPKIKILKKNLNRKQKLNQIKDRQFIEGYLKGKQLGRGGFSHVWEGFNIKDKKFYAIKQLDIKNKFQTHITQIKFGEYFFNKGQAKQQFRKHPGINHLIAMYEYSIINPKAYIVYESCQGSLGGLLYDIYEDQQESGKEENEKLYYLKYRKLYGQLRKQTNFLKCLIYQVCLCLDLLQKNNIVHSDLKTENILLKKKDQNKFIFKLIDYGSSFVFKNLKQYKLATPQYMCPQLLNYILYENGRQYRSDMLKYLKNYKNISAIDMWGLGSIILQLIHGLPLWLTNPTKLIIDKNEQIKKGLFAVTNRSFDKILERQIYIIQNLDDFILLNNNSRIVVDQKIIKILKGVLNKNPQQRLRPKQVIKILKN